MKQVTNAKIILGRQMLQLRYSCNLAILIQSTLLAVVAIWTALFVTIVGADVPYTVTHGIIIDAATFGSAVNVFTWPQRKFDVLPAPLTLPTDWKRSSRWETPALSTYADHPEDIAKHLDPLILAAKQVLVDFLQEWPQIPIFFKGTSSIRSLKPDKRDALMSAVSAYLGDPARSPFYFAPVGAARVIAGEEQAAYAWTTVNFLLGTLELDSAGFGSADGSGTVGSLDLGGDSASVAFYPPGQDIASGIFKLQFGDSKHWNIYAHNHVGFGVETAQRRMRWDLIAQSAGYTQPDAAEGEGWQGWPQPPAGAAKALATSAAHKGVFFDPCLPAGHAELLVVQGHPLEATGVALGANFTACLEAARRTLLKNMDAFCLEENHQACSFAGTYQPTLPPVGTPNGDFVLIEAYTDLWQAARLPSTATLAQLGEAVSHLCALSLDELTTHFNNITITCPEVAKWGPGGLCWLGSYALALLGDGYGFAADRALTVASDINGNHVDWALGAMIYEINALPWIYTGDQPWVAFGTLLTLIAGLLALLLINSLLAICSHGARGRGMTLDPVSEIVASRIALSRLHLPSSASSFERYRSIHEALDDRVHKHHR